MANHDNMQRDIKQTRKRDATEVGPDSSKKVKIEHICDVCQVYKTTDMSNLNRHSKTCRTKQEKRQDVNVLEKRCDVCQVYRTTDMSNLKRHIKTCRTEQEKRQDVNGLEKRCDVCQVYKTTDMSNLKRHIKNV